MQRRHEYALMSLLEEVAFRGVSSVLKGELMMWFTPAAHFAVNIRRDIRARWEELVKEMEWWDPVPALKIAEEEGYIVLVRDNLDFRDE
jgi:hypothetical protein